MGDPYCSTERFVVVGVKTFKFRLYPSQAQQQRMFQVLDVCRHFTNMCLEDRKLAYELEQRRVKRPEQEKMAIRYRQAFAQAGIVFSQTLQTVVDDLEKAFKAFFRRVKSGEKPGYPRFKSRTRFHSFAFKQFGCGAKLDGRRLKLFGIGRVPVRWHRPMEGKIKTVRIVYKAGRWFACFVCEVPDTHKLPETGRSIGMDVNVENMLTTSEGERVENPKFYRKAQAKLCILQRRLQRKQKGGKNRKKALLQVQRWHEHIANQRKDFLHKLTFALVQNCDRIALEDLKTQNLVRNPRLSKSILDSGWYLFRHLLTYKAANAGRAVVRVNPAYTSKTCSCCGAIFEDLKLSDRWVQCDCGLCLSRDHNAAINILKRAGWDASVSVNGEQWLMRCLEAARL